MRTIRLITIIHAQAIRPPGRESNSVQIDCVQQDGLPVRIILEPLVLQQIREGLESRVARRIAAAVSHTLSEPQATPQFRIES